MGKGIRNIVLSLLGASAFSALAVADYYLRHEEVGRTRRDLTERGYAINSDSVIHAAIKGDQEALELLVRVGVDIGEPAETGETALISAVESGDAEMVDYLLEKKGVIQSLEHQGADGQTALTRTIAMREFLFAEKLLSAGAVMNAVSSEGNALLVIAVESDDEGLFSFLIKHGVEPDEKNEKGETALSLAVERGNLKWVDKLLRSGADANQKKGVLLLGLIGRGQDEMMKLLIKHGARVNGKNEQGESLLMVATEKKDGAAVSVLLEEGVKLNERDETGRSVVDRLIDTGQVEMLEIIAGKIDGGIPDDWMLKALASGKEGLLKELLLRGGNVEASDDAGESLLKRAVLKKDMGLVKLLLQYGAKPKGSVWDALASGKQEILEVLLAKGADANEALVLGVGSPLSLALRQQRYDLAETLLKYGAEVAFQQTKGKSLYEEMLLRKDERAAALLEGYCGAYRQEAYIEDENLLKK